MTKTTGLSRFSGRSITGKTRAEPIANVFIGTGAATIQGEALQLAENAVGKMYWSVQSGGAIEALETYAAKHREGGYTASATTYQDVGQNIEALRCEMAELRNIMEALLEAARENKETRAFVTYITSLGYPDVVLNRPIPVTIREDEGEFIASFLDANISSGGDTVQAAVSSLQSLLVDFFEIHEDSDESTLSPLMHQQRTVLMDVICRHSPKTTQKRQPRNSGEGRAAT